MVVHVTDHAYKRAKERFNWSPATIEKMAQKAYDSGLKHKDTKGVLNKYLTSVWAKNKTANNISIHGEVIYIFCFERLITVYHIPSELRKNIKWSKCST